MQTWNSIRETGRVSIEIKKISWVENSLILSKYFGDSLSSSAKIVNPWRSYFMSLAFKHVSEVNPFFDHDNRIELFRNAIVRSGLALNENCCWEIIQNFQLLRDIMQRFQM